MKPHPLGLAEQDPLVDQTVGYLQRQLKLLHQLRRGLLAQLLLQLLLPALVPATKFLHGDDIAIDRRDGVLALPLRGEKVWDVERDKRNDDQTQGPGEGFQVVSQPLQHGYSSPPPRGQVLPG